MAICYKCGKCCIHLQLSADLSPEMREWYSAHYGREIQTVSFRIHHRCVQLDENNLCKIYQSRPEICKKHMCKKDEEKLLVLEFDAGKEDV